METSTIMKLISHVLIWTILIMGNYASRKYSYDPMPQKTKESDANTTKTTTTTTSKTNSAMKQSTGNQTVNPNTNSQTQNAIDTDTENIPSNLNTTNGYKNASTLNDSVVSQNAAFRSITIHEEKNSFSSSVWIYITVGVLCVAVFNVYVFWYRKRAATYTFESKRTSKR